MVQELQPFKREEGAHFADGFRFFGDDRCEPAGGNDGSGMSQFPFHTSEDAIDQTHVPEEEAALNAPDRIGADHRLGPDDLDLG